MSVLKQPDPAKLVIGCLMNNQALVEPLFVFLEDQFGPVDMISRWLAFPYTDYYEREMGSPLHRKIFVFRDLIRQEDLAGIKEKTNGLEKGFSSRDRRNVNIDPGYLLSSRFILATGKDYSHRICIGNGVYGDLTLMYQRNAGFQTLPWTYPDYASEAVISFLSKARDKYILDLKTSLKEKA